MGLLLLAQTYAGYLSSHYMICSFYLAVTGAAGAASYICSLDSQVNYYIQSKQAAVQHNK
jgi:hypothetical protein